MFREPTRTTWNTLLDDKPTSNTPRIKFSYAFSEGYSVKGANHILEIGCGTGSFTQLIDREGCVGVDIGMNGLKVAKTYCRKSEFIACSATNLPFRDNVFDYTCMWGVFEELPLGLERLAIMEVRRILLKNGIYLLSVYSDHILSKLFDPAFIFGGVRHYNASRFMKLLSDMGFRIIKFTIRGQLYTLMAIFSFYFYKHLLHMKESKLRSFLEAKSMEEIYHKQAGVVYTFIAASKRPED